MAVRFWICLSLAATVLSPVAALAQDPGSDPRRMVPRPEWSMPGPLMPDAPGAQLPGADPFHLLENSVEVQADLGLSRGQLDRLHQAGRNFRNKLQELLHPKPGVPQAQVQAEIERHVASTRGMIARELTPQQLGRLQQIMLQLEGPCLAVMDRELGQQLALSAEQHRALAEGCRQRAARMRSAFQPPSSRDDFCAVMASNRNRVEKVRAQADQEIVAVLRPQQRETFNRLLGVRLRLEPPEVPNCPT